MNNQRNIDILYMQTECLWLYSRKTKLSMKECVLQFQKYHIFEYISACYDYLHLSGSEYIVNDIVKRIREGVNFAI